MDAKTIIIFSMVLSLSVPVCADTVILRNNDVIECVVLSEENERVTVSIKGGTMVLHAAEIQEIRRTKQTENNALQQKWNTELVRQQDKAVHRAQQGTEKSKRTSDNRENNGKKKIVKRLKKRTPPLDIRKSKEQRSGWGRVEKSDWDTWGEEN